LVMIAYQWGLTATLHEGQLVITTPELSEEWLLVQLCAIVTGDLLGLRQSFWWKLGGRVSLLGSTWPERRRGNWILWTRIMQLVRYKQ
jgi:hypothetical protein